MDIRRNRERRTTLRQVDGQSAFVLLQQSDQLTEDLREVTSIDLIDQQDVRIVEVIRRSGTDTLEHTVDQLEPQPALVALNGPEALDEVLVAVGGVEGHPREVAGGPVASFGQHRLRAIERGIAIIGERVQIKVFQLLGEPPVYEPQTGIGLARPRRSVQDRLPATPQCFLDDEP